MNAYTWAILSKDTNTASMVVEFDHNGDKTALNLPLPPVGAVLEQWITGFAPPRKLDFDDVQVGTTGVVMSLPDETFSSTSEDMPNLNGNWNEEYIRALIYQVMEEIREASV